LIRIENISHAYQDVSALQSIDFCVDEGEKVVLLGTNGCGKSTLLKILNGLIEPTQGTVFFRGRNLADMKGDAALRQQVRRRTVLLFQNPDAMLFNPTVADEIGFGPRHFGLDDVPERIAHWARELQVTDLLARAPYHLSTGEKQRVCLAALLIMEPDLLLLDEPTGSLDPRSTGWLVDFVQDLSQTVITTTHNLSLARELGNRCLVLGEDHTLLHDGESIDLMDDTELLIRANLMHIHKHRHRDGQVVHKHYHSHDWS
jgi:cobalt/nickel transport system ATP-binding protein